MDSRETAIELAIQDLNAGVFASQRAAAKAYGIPRTTLQDRLKGATDRVSGHQHQQRLSPEQEESLVEWILNEDARACPPSHARVREMADRILRMNGDLQPVGQLWIPHFVRRNPRVASIIGRKLAAERASAATPEQIRAFLELVEEMRQRFNIPYDDVYNMDETGVALGVCTNTRVLASSLKIKAYIKSPENREWVSIIECISATGKKLRCVVIFKGQCLQSTWFTPEAVPDWLYTTSENGWTSNEIGGEWLRRIFLPETAVPAGQHRLLILDGHGSHIDIEFLWLCKQNQVVLVFLPPHTSHVLQPLDLTPFSVIKSRYRSQIRDLALLDDAAPVKKERFIRCYHFAREESLTERVIRAGWRAAGICPYNIDLVLASSQVQQRPTTPEHQEQPLSPTRALYTTPRKPQDIYLAQQQLRLSENLSKPTRWVLHKASKALSAANTRSAMLEAENQRLKFQLDALTPIGPRQRVRQDPNQRFANVENIMEAINKSKATKARRERSTKKKKARATVTTASATSIESMCTQWQLNM